MKGEGLSGLGSRTGGKSGFGRWHRLFQDVVLKLNNSHEASRITRDYVPRMSMRHVRRIG